ncbi:hypothetical protein MoryE10_26060 [Methylogaea oryzae]|uniref:Glycoamylase-like domain-containing protein n=2 Tax=Methylogaea oryzae TaxID=1295382 RepID=A0A8D5ANE1_9GAMM|nr:hypothetical protein MoryE10_26060 [Methylogaea oryzae]
MLTVGLLALATHPAVVVADHMGPPPRPIKDNWQLEVGGKDLQARLKERLVGWPTTALVKGSELPKDGQAFLQRVAADTWRGLAALTDKENGLPLDTVNFSDASVDPSRSLVGDYTSPTNIGMRFVSLGAAMDLKLIDRRQALAAAEKIVSTLERLERHEGFFYNYYDTTTLERSSHFVSFVDSAWLTAGLMAARQTFPELAQRCSQLIDQGNYRFFYDENLRHMRQGYEADHKHLTDQHYGVMFTEARLGSLLAIGKGDVPAEHWFAMHRTLPEDHTWQAQTPIGRHPKNFDGLETRGGRYRYKDWEFVPSWGGSMFEALMPRLVVDEGKLAPNSLGRNGAIHTEIQRRYALEELKYPVWGMSPSATPGGPYHEYGAKMLGVSGYQPGVVTPHAAALALLTEPKQATANLMELARRYPVYGEYGFYDAVDPNTGKVAYQQLTLDQSMMFLAIANHLSGGKVHKRFTSDPIMQKVLPLIRKENFFD